MIKKVFESTDITKDPNFKKWFGNSKVVDNAGDPLVVYHGGTFSGGEFRGKGWFTVSRKDAKYYAKQLGGSVISAYLLVKNPLYSGYISHLNIEADNQILGIAKRKNIVLNVVDNKIIFIETNGAVLIAQDIGKDGVIDLDRSGNILDIVVFNPNQIKSVDAKEFNPNSNNIYEKVKK
jgi:hypothetical protein